MISKKFIQSSFIYSVVGALPYVSGLILTLVFISKLTKEQVGINALYFSILFLIQIFSSFSLETYIGIYFFDYKNDKKKLSDFISTIFITLLVFGIVIITILSLGGTIIFKIIFLKILNSHDIPFYPWGFITILTAVFTGFLKTYSSLLINQQRPMRFFRINLLNFVLTLIVSISLLYIYPYTLIGPMWGRLVPSVISFIIIIGFIIKEYDLRFSTEYLKGIKAFCFPMVFYALFIWIVSYIDRFIIKYFLVDPTYVGIFDIAIKCTLVIDFIQAGLANAIHPKVFTIWKDKNLKESTMEVNRYYNSLSAFTLLMIPLFIIIVPILIPYVVKKEIYYQIFDYFPILCLGFATRVYFYMFLAPIYFFKQTKVLPKIFFFTAIFQIITSALLIKYFGLTGAVWAAFIIKPIQAFFLYFESKKIFKFNINKVKLFYLPLFFIFMVLFSELFLSSISLLIRSGIQFIIIAGLIYAVYRKEIFITAKQLIPWHR